MPVNISSSVSYTLGAAEDNLTLTGTANINGVGNALVNIINGNSGANLIKGLGGADTLYGYGGNDTLYAGDVGATGDVNTDLLYGGTGADVLYADGNDYLYGEAGADTLHGEFGANNRLAGGTENDIYYVSANGSTITELAAAGSDTVYSSDSIALNGAILVAGGTLVSGDVENLTLTGAANIDGVGNGLGNMILGNAGNNVLSGGLGIDTISAGDGNDTLYGVGAGAGVDAVTDNLDGGLGNDTLYGNGSDFLSGGLGDDVYLLIGGQNRVTDSAGFDVVKTESSFTFGYTTDPAVSWGSGPIEVIELTGSLNTFANGEAGANTLLGNSGANTLDGRGGNDILDGRDGDDVLKIGSDTGSVGGATNMTGGAGADTFWTGKGYRGDHSSGANQLQINDFTSGVDHIRFGIATTATAPTTLSTTAVYGGDTLAMVLDRAASGSGSPTAPTISQFVFGADTYLVLDLSTATTFSTGDLAIKLTGTPGVALSDLVFNLV